MNNRNVVEILYTDECPFWKEVLKIVEQLIHDSKTQPTVRKIKIQSLEEAKLLKFPGSPTIRVNGVDIDPSAKTVEGYIGCRIYRYEGRIFEYPPKEMIESAFARLMKK